MIEKLDSGVIVAIAKRAGEEILEVYGSDFSVEQKEDSSPLTEADSRANAVIVGELDRLYPDIPIISEETKAVDYEVRKHWDRFWLVDPLDGTREFIKRNGEFTVNIALVENGTPVLGVVYQPIGENLYYAQKGRGAWKTTGGGAPEKLRGGRHFSAKEQVVVVASRSHLTPEVKQFVVDLQDRGKSVEFISAGSSLKLCLVAEGVADVYPRLGPTMEWDTAAAHAVALEAGRDVISWPEGKALVYNKEDLLNPFFTVE